MHLMECQEKANKIMPKRDYHVNSKQGHLGTADLELCKILHGMRHLKHLCQT